MIKKKWPPDFLKSFQNAWLPYLKASEQLVEHFKNKIDIWRKLPKIFKIITTQADGKFREL